MARTNETYFAVINSPLMTDTLKQIYHVLWAPTVRGNPAEGLTKAEIVQNCEYMGCSKNPADPWEKAVPLLAKMGLAKRGSKRHCTVKNKEDVTWFLTDASVPLKTKSNKPSAKQYIKGVAQLEALIVHHTAQGDGLITPELTKLYEWVRDKVPELKGAGS